MARKKANATKLRAGMKKAWRDARRAGRKRPTRAALSKAMKAANK